MFPCGTVVVVAAGHGVSVGATVGTDVGTGVGVLLAGGPEQHLMDKIDGPGGDCRLLGVPLLLPPQLRSTSADRAVNAGSKRNQIRLNRIGVFTYDGSGQSVSSRDKKAAGMRRGEAPRCPPVVASGCLTVSPVATEWEDHPAVRASRAALNRFDGAASGIFRNRIPKSACLGVAAR